MLNYQRVWLVFPFFYSTSTIFADLGPLIKTQVEHHQQVGADEGARH